MQGQGFINVIAGGRKFPGPWIAPTWTRDPATGLWSNVPVPGNELITDPGMDSAGKWTAYTGWDVGVTTPGVATKTAGTASNLSNTTLAPVILNHWYRAICDVVVNAGGIRVYVGNDTYRNITATASNVVVAIRTHATNSTSALRGDVAFAGTADNFSIKPLPLSQILAYRNYGRQVSIASAFTRTIDIPGGVVSRLSVNPDGTFNYVHCWHNGTNLYLDTVVNSLTVVNKVTVVAAYGAGRVVKINFSAANTAQAFYNGVQVGADADISEVPAGTMAGLFLTGAGTLGDPVIT